MAKKTKHPLDFIKPGFSFKNGGSIPKAQEGFSVDPEKGYTGNKETDLLIQKYAETQKKINEGASASDVYVQKLRKIADELIDKGFTLEESGVLPKNVLNWQDPKTGEGPAFCIGSSCYLAKEAGDPFFFTSNTMAQDDARHNPNSTRYLEQSEKYIAPGDILQFKQSSNSFLSDEKASPYHAYTVYDIDQPNRAGDRIVTVVGSKGHGPMIKKTFVLGKDNKLYEHKTWGTENDIKGAIQYATQLLKRKNADNGYNELIKQRDSLKEQINELDPAYFYPGKDIRYKDYKQTAFELTNPAKENSITTGKVNWNVPETIDTKESRLAEIVSKYDDPQYKYKYMRSHNISSSEYDALVSNMIGIYGAESKFGTDYVGKSKGPEWPWLSKMLGNNWGKKHSVGPFQVTYNQLPENYKKGITVGDLYDPVRASEATMEYLTEGLTKLRKRSQTTPETATKKNPYSQAITPENYLEFLPYLYNAPGWLSGDVATQQKYGDILKGESDYKKLVDFYRNQAVETIPTSLSIPKSVDIKPEKAKGGTVWSIIEDVPKAQTGKIVKPVKSKLVNSKAAEELMKKGFTLPKDFQPDSAYTQDVINTAIRVGMNPFLALGVVFQESGLKPDYADNPLRMTGNAYKEALSKRLLVEGEEPLADAMRYWDYKTAGHENEPAHMRYQRYNGLGWVTPKTENLGNKIYGVTLKPGEGINMAKTPLYGRAISDYSNQFAKTPKINDMVRAGYLDFIQKSRQTKAYGGQYMQNAGPVNFYGSASGLGRRPDERNLYGNYTEEGPTGYSMDWQPTGSVAVPKGTSVHQFGITNVPDSPCGPGFAIDYDENGYEVCVPLKGGQGQGQPDYVRSSWDPFTQGRLNYGQGVRPLETNSTWIDDIPRPGKRARGMRNPNSPGFFSQLTSGIKSLFTGSGPKRFGSGPKRCAPGDKCFQFADGGPFRTHHSQHHGSGINYGPIEPYNISDPEKFKRANKAYEDSLAIYQKGKDYGNSIRSAFGKFKKVENASNWGIANSDLYKISSDFFKTKLRPEAIYGNAENSIFYPQWKKPVRKPVYTPEPTKSQPTEPKYTITHNAEPTGPPNYEIPKEETIMMPNGVRIPKAEFENRYGTNVTKREFEKKDDGGVITTPYGQWQYPGEVTRIPSNQITMQGVPYPVLGVDDMGHTQLMQPGGQYQFPGTEVTEYPIIAQDGHSIQDEVNKGLGNPMGRAEREANSMVFWNDEDPGDSDRHSAAGKYTAEAIKDILSWMPAGLPQVAGFLGSTALGLGHEVIEPNRSPNYSWWDTIREGSEDAFNNMVGAAVGVMPVLEQTKKQWLRYLTRNNYLPDGYANNVKGQPANMYFKSKGGPVTWSIIDDLPKAQNGKSVTVTLPSGEQKVMQTDSPEYLYYYSGKQGKPGLTKYDPATDTYMLDSPLNKEVSIAAFPENPEFPQNVQIPNQGTIYQTPESSWRQRQLENLDKITNFSLRPGKYGYDDSFGPVQMITGLATYPAESALSLMNPKEDYEKHGALGVGMHVLGAMPFLQGKSLLKALGTSEIDAQLAAIEKEGLEQGLSSYEIAKNQLEKVGITSNQREAYVPGVSDFLHKNIYPFGYTGLNGESKLKQTLRHMILGTKPHAGDPIINNRYDAWRLYLGLPQKNNTFRLAETAPINHPAYSPKTLKGMDIYGINDNYQILDDFHYNIKKFDTNPITEHIGYGVDPVGVMGGYNRRLSEFGFDYNDIWDLTPNLKFNSLVPKQVAGFKPFKKLFYTEKLTPEGIAITTPRSVDIPISKFIGKPFMSHGYDPYTASNYKEDLLNHINKQIESLNTLDINPEDVPLQLNKLNRLTGFKKRVEPIVPIKKQGGKVIWQIID